MVFPVDVIIPWVSRVMTLVPGDVIATGTPAGVGPIKAGDVVEVVIAGIGSFATRLWIVRSDLAVLLPAVSAGGSG